MAAFSDTSFSTSAFSTDAFSFDVGAAVVAAEQNAGGWLSFFQSLDRQRKVTPEVVPVEAVEAVKTAAVIEDRLQYQQEEARRLAYEQAVEDAKDKYIESYRDAFLKSQTEGFVAAEVLNQFLVEQWQAEVAERRRQARRRKALLLFLLH